MKIILIFIMTHFVSFHLLNADPGLLAEKSNMLIAGVRSIDITQLSRYEINKLKIINNSLIIVNTCVTNLRVYWIVASKQQDVSYFKTVSVRELDELLTELAKIELLCKGMPINAKGILTSIEEVKREACLYKQTVKSDDFPNKGGK